MKILPAFLSVGVLMFAVLSCGPSQFAVHVEMRHPSKSGMDLFAKTLAVVHAEDDDKLTTEFTAMLADGFAYSLEQKYQLPDGSVGVYSVPYKKGAAYSSRDSLINILLEVGSDVVFLFDPAELGGLSTGATTRSQLAHSVDSSYVNEGRLPFSLKLYAYDSMNKEDKVFVFTGASTVSPRVYSDGKDSREEIVAKFTSAIANEAWKAGKEVSESFASEWKHEQYSLLYFESDPWYKALILADRYEWKAAADLWMSLLSSRDIMKKACAEYNIAVSCYMLGDIPLAKKWLDLADSHNKVYLSDGLRKRIEARLK